MNVHTMFAFCGKVFLSRWMKILSVNYGNRRKNLFLARDQNTHNRVQQIVERDTGAMEHKNRRKVVGICCDGFKQQNERDFLTLGF